MVWGLGNSWDWGLCCGRDWSGCWSSCCVGDGVGIGEGVGVGAEVTVSDGFGK